MSNYTLGKEDLMWGPHFYFSKTLQTKVQHITIQAIAKRISFKVHVYLKVKIHISNHV